MTIIHRTAMINPEAGMLAYAGAEALPLRTMTPAQLDPAIPDTGIFAHDRGLVAFPADVLTMHEVSLSIAEMLAYVGGLVVSPTETACGVGTDALMLHKVSPSHAGILAHAGADAHSLHTPCSSQAVIL